LVPFEVASLSSAPFSLSFSPSFWEGGYLLRPSCKFLPPRCLGSPSPVVSKKQTCISEYSVIFTKFLFLLFFSAFSFLQSFGLAFLRGGPLGPHPGTLPLFPFRQSWWFFQTLFPLTSPSPYGAPSPLNVPFWPNPTHLPSSSTSPPSSADPLKPILFSVTLAVPNEGNNEALPQALTVLLFCRHFDCLPHLFFPPLIPPPL